MEELVRELAGLQAELAADTKFVDGDGIVITLRESVADAKAELAKAEAALAEEMLLYASSTIEDQITDTKERILDEWDGEAKTYQYDFGKLALTTTKSVVIGDGAFLLANLIEHFSTSAIADTYITGFKKTAIRKFVDLFPQPPEVVDLIEKTTIKLEV